MALQDGTENTYANVQPGEILPVSVIRINSSGTTCVGIIVFY